MDSPDLARSQLDRAIELKEFEIQCAEVIADKWSDRSDRAWLLSLFEGTLGTTLAVLRGRTAREWGEEVAQLRRELVELQTERRLLGDDD